MDTLYECIKNRDVQAANFTAVVVEGPDTGEKIFVSDGNIIWHSDKYEFLKSRLNLLEEGPETGLTEVEGRRIFCEYVGNRNKLIICGGGHVSIPIIQIGKSIGFYITVLEDRPKFADAARRAGADRVICDSFEQGMSCVDSDMDTYFVIVTRGHRYDSICLAMALQKANAYIGMMGSRKRVGIVKEQLIEDGAPKKLLDKVYTPIGLSIGAETPEEIAVSIMAEIIQVKNIRKCSAGYDTELLNKLVSEVPEVQKKVLAVIVSRKGSAPRETGTKMLICEDGTVTGTIGGGCAEAEIIQKSIRMMNTAAKSPLLTKVDMTGREAEEDGMVCGGTIEVWLELIQ